MNRFRGLWLFWACGLLLASCGHQAANPKTANPAPASEKPAPAPNVAGPMSVESYRKLDLQPGIQLHMWNIQANSLKELSVSLLIIRDGKPEITSKIEYKWETWESSEPPAIGQIMLLLQDGQLFGVADRRVPLLMDDFPKLPPGSRAQVNSNVSIEGRLMPGAATTTNEGTFMSFPPGHPHKKILYGAIFVPENFVGSVSLAPNIETLSEAASDGRVVVAISLEWIPQ
jgi:hypothetical protein